MAHLSMNIHCTGVTARARAHSGVQWVTLTFECGDARPEIMLFFGKDGLAESFAAHVGAFVNEQVKEDEAVG